MCSICGFSAINKASAKLTLDMMQQTKHRGPDGYGLYVDGKIKKSKTSSDLATSESAKICIGHAKQHRGWR